MDHLNVFLSNIVNKKCNKPVNYQIHTANFQKHYKSYRPQTFEQKCSYLCLIVQMTC